MRWLKNRKKKKQWVATTVQKILGLTDWEMAIIEKMGDKGKGQ